MSTHRYQARLSWTGSTGNGYRGYSRTHTASAPPAKNAIELTADPHFRGDPDLTNPEQLLLMAASSCQLLSFLSLAARAGVDVLAYEDDAGAVMPESDPPTRITEIALAPTITVTAGTDHEQIRELVRQAHEQCFIANSLTSSITIDPVIRESG